MILVVKLVPFGSSFSPKILKKGYLQSQFPYHICLHPPSQALAAPCNSPAIGQQQAKSRSARLAAVEASTPPEIVTAIGGADENLLEIF